MARDDGRQRIEAFVPKLHDPLSGRASHWLLVLKESCFRESDQKPNQPPQAPSRRSIGPPRSAVLVRPSELRLTPA